MNPFEPFDRPEPWPQIVCVLCGMIVMFNRYGSLGGYDGRCVANGGGRHIEPGTPEAEAAKEMRAAWLRDPVGARVK